MLLTGRPLFCFRAVGLAAGLMVGLAIGRIVSMASKIACQLIRIILMERVDKLSKMLDR